MLPLKKCNFQNVTDLPDGPHKFLQTFLQIHPFSLPYLILRIPLLLFALHLWIHVL